LELILFSIFKFIAILSAIMVVNSRSPVHAVLLLVLVFANITGILLILEAEFLALVFLVVYIGAIAVLFLFVVMMLNIKLVELTTSVFNYLPLNAFVLLIIALQTSYFLYLTFYPWQPEASISFLSFINYLDSFSNISIIGQALFLFYFFPFLLTGLVLLIAMIGSILLTLSHQLSVRRQSFFVQTTTESWKSLTRHS